MKRILNKKWRDTSGSKNNRESGFTLMEMVIAIPLITLTGGFMVAVIGNSMLRMNENTLMTNAGAETELVVENLKKSRNCYELNNLVDTEWENTSEINSSNEANKARNKFRIVSSYADETCVAGSSNTIKVQAVSDKDSKVLFETTSSVYIGK